MAAAVNRWTREGKKVTYILATSGEAGIEGMAPTQAGPLREEEQRRSAAQVGVKTLVWLDLPDSKLAETPHLTESIRQAIDAYPAEVVIATYGGPEWAPGIPNQADHTAVSEAVREVLKGRNVWHFENGPGATHHVRVDDADLQAAVDSLAEHRVYLSVLDPQTPVLIQARNQIYRSVARDAYENKVHFTQVDAPAEAALTSTARARAPKVLGVNI